PLIINRSRNCANFFCSPSTRSTTTKVCRTRSISCARGLRLPRAGKRRTVRHRDDVGYDSDRVALLTRSEACPRRLFLRLLPDRAVHLLIKRRASGRELAQLVVLGAHQRRAITEGAASPLAVEPAFADQLTDEVRLRQRRPADAHKRR